MLAAACRDEFAIETFSMTAGVDACGLQLKWSTVSSTFADLKQIQVQVKDVFGTRD